MRSHAQAVSRPDREIAKAVVALVRAQSLPRSRALIRRPVSNFALTRDLDGAISTGNDSCREPLGQAVG